MKYNMSEIFKRAWAIYRNDNTLTFGDALRQSWSVAKNGMAVIRFNQIYAENYKKVLVYVLGRVNGKHEIAEEITQDVFVKVNEHLRNYDVYKAKFTTWIYTIANNRIIDYYRADKSAMTINVDGYVNDQGDVIFQYIDNSHAEDRIETKDTVTAIERAMSMLSNKEREIANLFFIKEMKYTEIANVLDIPIGTVKGLINRIRGKLQTSLSSVYATL